MALRRVEDAGAAERQQSMRSARSAVRRLTVVKQGHALQAGSAGGVHHCQHLRRGREEGRGGGGGGGSQQGGDEQPGQARPLCLPCFLSPD